MSRQDALLWILCDQERSQIPRQWNYEEKLTQMPRECENVIHLPNNQVWEMGKIWNRVEFLVLVFFEIPAQECLLPLYWKALFQNPPTCINFSIFEKWHSCYGLCFMRGPQEVTIEVICTIEEWHLVMLGIFWQDFCHLRDRTTYLVRTAGRSVL